MPVFRRRLVDHENFDKEQTKTLFVLDRAYIDAAFWKPPPGKRQGRWDVITRMKKCMKPTCCGEHQFDRDDPVNAGVRRVWTAGFDGAFGLMYVVEFVDPETSEAYRFLTTLDPQEIRPGVIAYLYFLRWRIEKSFDTFKTDFHETKAWAGGKTCASHAQQLHHHGIQSDALPFELFGGDAWDSRRKG